MCSLMRKNSILMARMGFIHIGMICARKSASLLNDSLEKGAIGYKGKLDLVIIDTTLDSVGYVELLQNNLKRGRFKIAGRGWKFQQNNASVHCARIVKQWFEDNKIKVLVWPSKSPDLNIIENL